jgi:hypothetical protein
MGRAPQSDEAVSFISQVPDPRRCGGWTYRDRYMSLF